MLGRRRSKNGSPLAFRSIEWDSEAPVMSEPVCPYAVAEPVLFVVPTYLMELLASLAKEFPGYEFLVYTKAEKVTILGREAVRLGDPVIPRQTVSYASVDVEEHVDAGAVIHKHPSGLRSFSQTDDTYINANNDYSLLYVDGWLYQAAVRVRLPCGAVYIYKFAPSIVLESVEPPRSLGEMVAEAKEKIKPFAARPMNTYGRPVTPPSGYDYYTDYLAYRELEEDMGRGREGSLWPDPDKFL